MKEVVVIGAGLTGLTAAWNLRKQGKDLLLLEQSGRIGGVINSVRENGFLYEEGPNSGVVGNVEVVRLFNDLAADCELELANHHVKRRFVLKNGRWQPLPGGLKAAVTTPLFTWKDKFRILLEPFRPAGKNPHETLAGLVRRRMGNSFLNYAVDPFIIGVYAGDPNRLVPKYALPKLYNLEQQYGSFIGGTVKKQFQSKTEEEKQVNRSVFSVKGGLSGLTRALEKRIGKERIQCNCRQIAVQKIATGYAVTWINEAGLSETVEARNVISTVGAHQLGSLLPFLGKPQLDKITSLHYTRVLEVVLGFKEWKGFPLNGFGGLIPFVEKRDLLGVLFMSSLFSDRAPEGGALFSVFMGGVRRQDIFEMTDRQATEVLEREFPQLMQLDHFRPDLFKIIRHYHAIPQYEADSGERFEAIRQVEEEFPGLILGGNLRDGIGMADRIQQGKLLSEAIL
ncbi:MAG: protoporphyrinogen oxidase [Marinilabiliales bacterium]|nr:protoporphyrinogen oxidase [Marinilabiliales bacterium]